MMQSLDLSMPTHLTEALRTNMSGGKTVGAAARRGDRAACRSCRMAELQRARRRATRNDLVVLDVREKDAYEAGHIPGARLLPRGQLELRVNKELPDPTRAHRHLLRVRPHLDAGRVDLARRWASSARSRSTAA